MTENKAKDEAADTRPVPSQAEGDEETVDEVTEAERAEGAARGQQSTIIASHMLYGTNKGLRSRLVWIHTPHTFCTSTS